MSASPSDLTQGARKRANGAASHTGQYAPLSDGASGARSQPAAPAPLAGKIRIFVTLGLLLLTFSSLSAGRLRDIFGGTTPWSKATPPSGSHASSSLSSSPAAGTPPADGVPTSEDGLPSLHRRVVAIADIHGSLTNLLTILSMTHLITQSSSSSSSATSDPSVVWSPLGADDVLVSTGDNVDRGDDTIQIYKLWENLRGQAGEERVRTCLGNHEVMNALGDWRYVTPGDIKSFGGEKARRHAMSSQGWVGRNWLDHYNLSYSVDLLDAAKVRELQSSSSSSVREKGIPPLPSSYAPPRTNFVHGGLHPSFTSRHSLSELNAISHSFLTKALDAAAQGIELRGYLPPGTTQEEMAMWGEKGPYWYRGYSYEKEVDACRIAKEAMEGLKEGVGQIVMGHTPTFEHFVHRCPPRYEASTPTRPIPPLSSPPLINLIDTGISPAYSGVLSSLVFETWLHPEKKRNTPEEAAVEEEGEGTWEWVEKRTMRALYKEQGSAPGKGEWEDLVFEGRRVIV
ncbi:hypothetical protein BCV69DRAFT_311415 [Microstroma glucosiphilum]|uniref:Calcineurin-like phosphoesterase domain-containing protein n=1 Tax=Pseudomicrostroma glucosiphilum TaxID=1684307 RepID=A0A316UB54_9BASI|nr:hypothetical protein BCV69DRAFT_311415 [Pseudomicrostroma glucosiphilum]PWN21681.1 hypothetical protein BCV69DRAFT_311415 [Pseudomicrostroma glucosiphilum]